MGIVQKSFIIMLCMNLFLVIYINDAFDSGQYNFIGEFLDLSGDSPSFTGTNLSNSLPSTLEETSAIVGGDSLSLTDTFKMGWNFIKFIFSWLFAPVIIALVIPDIPKMVAAFLILPNVVILVFGTISMIRGYDW